MFKLSPVSFQSTAESEARNSGVLDPAMSTTVTCVALAAWFALSGAEAEGREVLMVSDMLVSEAAFALLVKNTPNKRIIRGKAICFLIILSIDNYYNN